MNIGERPTGIHGCKYSLAILLLVCSAGSARAQGDLAQFFNGGSQGQQFVSANQLRAPRKAQEAIDHARKDILHGHIESAQKEVFRALDLAPHYAVALTMQGALSLLAGNIDGASKAFQQAVEQDPTLGAAYVGVAVILISHDKFKDALIPLDRATSLLPNSWYVHWQAGLAHLGVGNTEVALQEADLAERFAGPDPERRSGASYLHALIYAVTKDPDRVKQYLAETITRYPAGTYATLAKSGRVERLQAAAIGKK